MDRGKGHDLVRPALVLAMKTSELHKAKVPKDQTVDLSPGP